MKTIQEFVASQFDALNCKTSIGTPGELNKHLYSLIVSSDFRRTALDSDSINDIQNKIKQQMSEAKPISFSIPFGAYKNWRLRSYPEPDWAEVFNINHLISYAMPIAAIYSPGVLIQYSFTDEVMDVVSNLPRDSQNSYVVAFEKILMYFQKRLPDNLRLRMVKINDFYSADDYRTELQQNYEFNVQNWESKYPKNIRDYKIESARHNLVLNGVKDLTKMSSSELENMYLQSAMRCDALDCLKKRRDFNKYSNNIQIVFVRGPTLSLHLGVCETGSMHFWVGSGIVEERQTRYLQRILSQPKFESLEQAGGVSLVEVENDLKSVSRNYDCIPVWNNNLLK